MTQLRLLLSLLVICLTLNSHAHDCECLAKVEISSLEKKGNQLLIHFSIKGDLSYHIGNVTVFNRSQNQTIDVISLTGDKSYLSPNTNYTLRWDVLVDVPIIENISKEDFIINIYLTQKACKYAKRWRNMSFGTLAVPFTGFTFGDGTRSRGLGLTSEVGVWFNKKMGNNGILGIDLTYSQVGLGLERHSNTIFREENVDVKNARLRLRAINIAPHIKWHTKDFTPFVGLNMSFYTSGTAKFRADGTKHKLPVYKNTDLFRSGGYSSGIQTGTLGWFIGVEWNDDKNSLFAIKFGGLLTDLVWSGYWTGFSPFDETDDVLGLRNNQLKYTYLSFTYKWRLSQDLIKFKG